MYFQKSTAEIQTGLKYQKNIQNMISFSMIILEQKYYKSFSVFF